MCVFMWVEQPVVFLDFFHLLQGLFSECGFLELNENGMHLRPVGASQLKCGCVALCSSWAETTPSDRSSAYVA